jgi:hypothetical protein
VNTLEPTGQAAVCHQYPVLPLLLKVAINLGQTNELDSVPRRLYLWMLKFEFYIIAYIYIYIYIYIGSTGV